MIEAIFAWVSLKSDTVLNTLRNKKKKQLKLIIIYVLLLNRRNIIIILIPFIDKKNWKTEEPHGEKKKHMKTKQLWNLWINQDYIIKHTFLMRNQFVSVQSFLFLSFLRYMSQERRHQIASQIVLSINPPEYTNDRIYISTYFRLFYIKNYSQFVENQELLQYDCKKRTNMLRQKSEVMVCWSRFIWNNHIRIWFVFA